MLPKRPLWNTTEEELNQFELLRLEYGKLAEANPEFSDRDIKRILMDSFKAVIYKLLEGAYRESLKKNNLL